MIFFLTWSDLRLSALKETFRQIHLSVALCGTIGVMELKSYYFLLSQYVDWAGIYNDDKGVK